MITQCLICNVAIFIVALSSAIYLYFKYAFTYWKKMGVPCTEPKFPYGSESTELEVKSIKPYEVALNDEYIAMKSKGYKFAGIYYFNNPILMAICPEFIKNVMLRDFGHFVDRGIYHDEENDPLSAHLFSLNGQKWKNLRVKLSPTFTSGKMKKMFTTLISCSQNLKECLDDLITKDEPIEIKKISANFTTDVIGSCAFGIECNSFKNPDAEFSRLSNKIVSPTGFDRVKALFSFAFPGLCKTLKLRITNKEVDYFFRKLVKDTIEYRETNNVTRNDFMQLLIQLKNIGVIEDDEHNELKMKSQEVETSLTINEVAAQTFLFFIAGFETSSTTLQFCMFELCQNQDIQNKLRDEIIRVLKNFEGKITYDALAEMHFMDNVINETLRKYPPVMSLQRVTTKDYLIPDTNITLKKGIALIIPIISLHMDPEYYPDPDRFDPDRFTKENKASRPDFTWLPFGEGPRVCIGLRFGMMQIKVGLCQMLLNYKFTLNTKTKLPLVFDPNAFVTSPLDKIWLNAEKI